MAKLTHTQRQEIIATGKAVLARLQEYKALPDPTRAALEALLTGSISQELKKQLKELLRLLGDPPDISRVPETFWANGGAALQKEIEPVLRDIYLAQAQTQIAATTIGVDWALVNQAAVNWARTYSFDLVSNITAGNRDLLQQSVSQYFAQPMTIGELGGNLAGAFGPVRSEMIAITEVTRAAVEGEQQAVNRITGDNPGIVSIDTWQTNRDDRVCPICGPRHNKKRGDGWEDNPPAHPRCRCWLKHDFEAA